MDRSVLPMPGTLVPSARQLREVKRSLRLSVLALRHRYAVPTGTRRRLWLMVAVGRFAQGIELDEQASSG